MRRYWLQGEPLTTSEVDVGGDLYHHIRDVCRASIGDHFELIASDRAYEVEVFEIGRKSLKAKVVGERPLPPAPRPHIHLAISCPRWSKLDWIVEKSVELGVKSLHIFVSEYSFARTLKDIPPAKLRRWETLIQMATQQCGRGDLMELPAPSTLKDLIEEVNRKPKVLSLFAYEGEKRRTLKDSLKGGQREFEDIWLWVGSEGGFSALEVDTFKGLGIQPISLGRHVLRVETACLVLVSVIKYEFQGAEDGPNG